ncbi:MAG: hypothetical protein VXZ38_12955 [Planctomycetota bacterium]|nr:hypothetical protein [Planctomycetota bacterium]
MQSLHRGPNSQAAETGSLNFRVTDLHEQPIPCRIHLFNSQGEAQQAPDCPFWHDHFSSSGDTQLHLAPDTYRWEIERGPEHTTVTGTAAVKAKQSCEVNVTLTRLDGLPTQGLVAEGWYSGDLHVHRPSSDIEDLMQAEDLNFATVIEWWNTPSNGSTKPEDLEHRINDRQVYNLMAGEDEREGGALLYFNLAQPLNLSVRSREYPSPMRFVEQAREINPNVWMDIEKPFWWDMPTWVVTAKPNSIEIAHNHMHRSGVLDSEAWGKSRDRTAYPGLQGNGFWTQDIYYHLLNAGFRIPPSAGSASGVLPNPIGHNRVYVHLNGEPLNRENWFRALSRGECFVTNGPLLRTTANQRRSGATFCFDDRTQILLDIHLSSREPVSHLEVIQNGEVKKRIPCDPVASQRIREWIEVEESGWFLIRAIGASDQTFHFSSTAPWFVEINGMGSTVDRRSAQFFLDWVEQRIQRVKMNLADPVEREEVLAWHETSKDFWSNRLRLASLNRDQYEAEMDRIGQSEALELVTTLRSTTTLTHFEPRMDPPTEGDFQVEEVINRLRLASNGGEVEKAIETLVWLDVTINPESRVKIESRDDQLRVRENRPTRRLARVENTAGITAPLNLASIDLSLNPARVAEWCNTKILNSGGLSNELTGELVEYKVVEITTSGVGLREIRIIGDAGQGTQDLGFRATADLLLNTIE